MLSYREREKRKSYEKQIHWQEINQQMTIVRIRLEKKKKKKKRKLKKKKFHHLVRVGE